jgi:hypothetical protein
MKVLITMYGDEALKDVDTPEGIMRTMKAWGEFGVGAQARGELLEHRRRRGRRLAVTVRMSAARRPARRSRWTRRLR